MITLYESQDKIFKKLKHLFQDTSNRYRENSLYLSGEMGVGKTYISSALVYDKYLENPDCNIIITTPKQVVQKFKKVLIEFGIPESNIHIYPKKERSCEGITIVESKYLNAFTNNYLLNKPDLVIVDEVHKLKGASLQGFEYLLKTLSKETRFLHMTGTIFDTDLRSLGKLLEFTHPNLFQRFTDYTGGKPNRKFANFEKLLANDIYKFISNFWRYISLSISLDDVDKKAENEVTQTFAPIDFIEYTEEESLYLSILSAQLSYTSMNYIERNKTLSRYLDNPEKELVYKDVTRFSKQKLRKEDVNILSIPLIETSINKSQKFKAFENILKTLDKDQRMLVYIEDVSIIEPLVKAVSDLGIVATGFTDYSNIDFIEKDIEQAYLKGNQVIFISYKPVETGVDIKADVLVWYQLAEKTTEFLQAQKRIHRLSSEQSSIIYLLAYKNTYQETLVNQVSNSAKYNASAYGKNLVDSLTKITGVVIPQDLF